MLLIMILSSLLMKFIMLTKMLSRMKRILIT
nr:MAG TPA: hypothetical protein [Caudoviricetes sp.]